MTKAHGDVFSKKLRTFFLNGQLLTLRLHLVLADGDGHSPLMGGLNKHRLDTRGARRVLAGYKTPSLLRNEKEEERLKCRRWSLPESQ